MNKTDLVNALAEKLGIPQYKSRQFLNAFQDVLKDSLGHEAIALQGFGTFEPWKQTKRQGRNPRTGIPCVIEARTSVKFKPGKYLLKALNTHDK